MIESNFDSWMETRHVALNLLLLQDTAVVKPDKYIFTFHSLNVVLSLQKGAYPKNVHLVLSY